ncbi:MAG: DUF4347 domain-containing protein [Cyanobacteria bacterium P01_E01_bin.45]
MIQDVQNDFLSVQVAQPIGTTSDRPNERLGQSSPVSLTFIDAAVDDIDTLIAQVEQGTQVILLDSTRDGVSQITEALAHYDNVASLNIVSHGQAGELQLGSSTIGSGDLAGYTSQFRRWQNVLTEDADILFYGCNVAAGNQGANFLQQLSRLTGADIAGSDDLTGSSALGGDWQLEVSTGAIEASSPFNSSISEAYNAVLESGRTVFSTNDNRGLQDYRIDSNTRHGVNLVNNPAGSGQVLRFDLRRNDPISNNRHRAEVIPRIPNENIRFGQAYTYSFRTFFPRDYERDSSGETIFQFNARPDQNLGENYRRPPVALRIQDGRFQLLQRSDADRVTNTRQEGTFRERSTSLGNVQLGQWIEWRVEVRWSHRGDGEFRLYQNDNLVVNQTGANTYNDRIAPFAKLGIYKSDWTARPQRSNTTRRVFFADDFSAVEGFSGRGGGGSRPARSQSVLEAPVLTNAPAPRNSNGSNQRSGSGRIRIEAESLQLNRYRAERNSSASGGRLISLNGRGNSEQGRATYVHRGDNGRFNLDLSYFDENDGAGQFRIQLNGRPIDSFRLNERSGSSSANNRSRRSFTVDGLNLRDGDRLTIIGSERGGEPVRLDYLELNPISDSANSSGNQNRNQSTSGNSNNRFEQTLQAEDARLIGARSVRARDRRGVQGNGFARFDGGSSAIEFTINVPEAGEYRLDYRYAQGADVSRSPINVLINGRRENSSPRFGNTGSATNYRLAGDTVFLRAGRNKIRLQSTSRTQANFDSLRVRAV